MLRHWFHQKLSSWLSFAVILAWSLKVVVPLLWGGANSSMANWKPFQPSAFELLFLWPVSHAMSRQRLPVWFLGPNITSIKSIKSIGLSWWMLQSCPSARCVKHSQTQEPSKESNLLSNISVWEHHKCIVLSSNWQDAFCLKAIDAFCIYEAELIGPSRIKPEILWLSALNNVYKNMFRQRFYT